MPKLAMSGRVTALHAAMADAVSAQALRDCCIEAAQCRDGDARGRPRQGANADADADADAEEEEERGRQVASSHGVALHSAVPVPMLVSRDFHLKCLF